MSVELLTTSDQAVESFVRGRTDGRICHLPAWSRMAERTVGHKTFYLVARDGQEVRGVLPLMHVRSHLFGNRMVSQALSDYGGPLAVDQTALDGLFQRAVELATEGGCESIEFRNVQPLPYALEKRTDKMTMHLPLKADPQELWQGFDPKVRNQVRKAEKSGIVADSGGLDLLDQFYDVYTIRMKQLGTPCYSRKVMRGLLEAFPDNSRLFVVRLEGHCLGGGLSLHLGGLVEMPFASMRVEYNKLCPNNLLYWTVLEHYCLAGARVFDFGRCTVGGSTHQFKKQWDPEPVELNYQYWVRPGHTFSLTAPSNPAYARKVELWKKLPLWVTRIVGPWLSRDLP